MPRKGGKKKGKVAKQTVKLYGHPVSQPTRSIMILCEDAGVNHEFTKIDLMKGEHKQPEYLAVNPLGAVPAIVDGDYKLREGAAIMTYLAQSRGLRKWYPKGAKVRAKVDMWMHWHHTGSRHLTSKLLVPVLFGTPNTEAGNAAAAKALAFIESQLEESPTPFLAGTKKPSLADLLIVPEIDQCGPDAFGLCELSPRIQQYLKDFSAAVPCYARNFAVVCAIKEQLAAMKAAAEAEKAEKPKHHVMYFGIPALGEPIRLMLALGGIEFTDQRLTFAEWPAIKPTTKWGQVPVLRTPEGEEMTQSTAIVRYLGTKVTVEGTGGDALYPRDAKLAYQVDELICAFEDARQKLVPTLRLPDEEKPAARQALFAADGAVTQILAKMDSLVPEGANHLVGGKLTLADVWCFYILGFLSSGFWDGVDPAFLDLYPNLKRISKTVSHHDGVKAYYAKFADNKMYAAFQPAE